MYTCLLNEALRLRDVAGENPEGVAFILRSPPSSDGKRGGESKQRSNHRTGLHTAQCARGNSAVFTVCRTSGAAFRRSPTSSRAPDSIGCPGARLNGKELRVRHDKAETRGAFTGGRGLVSRRGEIGECRGSSSGISGGRREPAHVDPAGRDEAASTTGGLSAILPIPRRSVGSGC